ncbi:BLUF domain-containing protein [Psychroserpens luteolus]|uniref:BLUF domain-containing protein n=1 Tax=Psychroserpens luteolus TaxID=2855840 RepID=UPI001E582CEA|nr:BLUF domain-containing protein [Psychroserpens luteolus]MCD2257632.1 BLUF domain-containing protein [Psychroserpens luteolus]
MIKSICYISNKNDNLPDSVLNKLLHSIIKDNNQIQVSGILMLQNNYFFQIMEGDPNTIDALFFKIRKDQRHHGLIKLLEISLVDRLFSDYQSGSFSVIRDFLNLKKLKIYFDWIKEANILEANKLIELTNNFLKHNK